MVGVEEVLSNSSQKRVNAATEKPSIVPDISASLLLSAIFRLVCIVDKVVDAEKGSVID